MRLDHVSILTRSGHFMKHILMLLMFLLVRKRIKISVGITICLYSKTDEEVLKCLNLLLFSNFASIGSCSICVELWTFDMVK